MNFLICCDFASVKCSHIEFANKLSEFTSYYSNLNDFTWIIEINEMDFIPFYPDDICKSIYYKLSEFLNKDSFFMVSKVSESFWSDKAQLKAFRSLLVREQ